MIYCTLLYKTQWEILTVQFILSTLQILMTSYCNQQLVIEIAMLQHCSELINHAGRCYRDSCYRDKYTFTCKRIRLTINVAHLLFFTLYIWVPQTQPTNKCSKDYRSITKWSWSLWINDAIFYSRMALGDTQHL